VAHPIENKSNTARACGDAGIDAGRGPGQRGWYKWLATRVAGASVLDVGCGLGYGLALLRSTALEVTGQDVDPQLASADIVVQPLDAIRSDAFDIVTAVDVIEHVTEDREFVSHLARIARSRVLLTTPNWTAGRCSWPFHVREYTPAQLRALCEPFGRCAMWKGTPDGGAVFPIRYPQLNDLLNRTRSGTLTSPVARLLNLAFPPAARIHSHLAVEIRHG
jgi:SAM-dependent methyltransferase